MRKLTILLFVLFGAIQLSHAQVYYEEEKVEEKQEEQGVETKDNSKSLQGLSFADRSYFGGNLALSFGTYTYIDVSPLWGYMVNRDLSVGAGATYIYSSREYIDFTGSKFRVDANLYGGRGFARHRVFNDVYIHAEFESINNEVLTITGETVREWVPGFFLGAGIFQPAFGRGGVNIFVMYNLMHDEFKSPYGSAWVIRAGFTL